MRFCGHFTLFRPVCRRWLMLGALWLVAPALAADEPLAVIVTPAHDRVLKKVDLALMFKRKKLFWGDGSRVQPINLPASNPHRLAFSQAVLGATPDELEKYWNDMYFHGIAPPFVVSSEEAVLRFVAENPGAIGYVPFCSTDSRVAVALVISAAGRVSDDVAAYACPQ